MRTKKTAVIHDWLLGMRGGENVLEAILELFPEADIFTLFYAPGKLSPTIERHRIQTSCLNKVPGAKSRHAYFLPWMPGAIERFDLHDYDLVISSSHCVAKGVIPPVDAPHLSYCHSPMRYAWDQYWDYFPKGLKEKIFFPWIHRLRQWDTSSQLRVDTFLANSEFVARRIRKYYRRDAAVVHPFVDLDFYQPREEARNQSYLVVSALVPYKRVDLAIEACRSLKKKLVIVGRGPEERRLKRLARGSDTTFLGSQPKEALKPLYSQCRGLLFPGVEDFGIVPLEAMACGTPVIALGRGGVLETVVEGRTGVFFEEPTVESLVGAILKFEKTYFSEDDCVSRAREFSKKRFQEEFQKYITIKI